MKFDFEAAVHAALEKSITDGVVEKLVTDNLNKAVSSAFTEQFHSYSEFTKAIKKAVAAAMEFDPDKFDVSRYNLLVRNVVQKRIQDVMSQQFADELDKALTEMYKPVPAEIKLSELVAAFLEEYEKDYSRKRADHAAVEVEESSYGYRYIKLRPDGSGKNKYGRDEMQLGINKEGVVFTVSIHGDPITRKLFLSSGSEFERLLIGLYMQKSRVTLDSYDSAYKEPPEDGCTCD